MKILEKIGEYIVLGLAVLTVLFMIADHNDKEQLTPYSDWGN